mgnify:CR=1 FL=1
MKTMILCVVIIFNILNNNSMKINWGTGIVIAFGLFMTFILYFVFEVQSNSKYDNDLVKKLQETQTL